MHQKFNEMADNLNKKGLDATRINIHEVYELRDWCKSLGCTEDELKVAVYKVGTSVKAVKKYLDKLYSRISRTKKETN